LIGFNDVFGGVVMVVSFAEKIAEGAVGPGGVLAVLDGSADQGGGVCLRVARPGQEHQQDDEKEGGGVRLRLLCSAHSFSTIEH
jgi:hypothetical protein